MFKKIKRDDKIFQSDLFLKDKLAFMVMISILNDIEKYPEAKVFSNGKNCVIVNSDPKHSVIAWTADDFCEYDQLYDFIKKEFHTNALFKIMSKKNFYDYLVKNHKIPELKIQTLGVYSCKKLKDIQYVGHPDQSKPEETNLVAQMIVNFGNDTGEYPNASIADYMDQAREFLSNPMYLVWRNKDEKIAALAYIRGNENPPRIGKVYTLPKERGNSYAKMLVHYLTAQTLKNKKETMLYTDFDYPSSNRCYQAIGYELTCKVVNFMPPLNNNTNEMAKRLSKNRSNGI